MSSINIPEPFTKHQTTDTIIHIGNAVIGNGHPCIIAGPCTIENETQLMTIAYAVKDADCDLLRGGTFKARTSPHSFGGLGKAGIDLLLKAKKETGLPVTSEIIDATQIDLFSDIDLIQIGARSMQNVALLKAVGSMGKPVLLKRGLCATIEEWLCAAEYLYLAGCRNIILCERGIRTFETATRNTLDLSAVAFLKQHTQLPVIVDPSHGTGISSLVPPMSAASIAAGADGLMLEVHPDPISALCDGPQAILPKVLFEITKKIKNF